MNQRILTRLAPALGLTFLLATAASSDAGTLGKVNRSVAKKQSSSRASGSSGSSSRAEPSRGYVAPTVWDRPRTCMTCQTIGWTRGGKRVRGWMQPELDVSFGYQNVVGSDGALNASARLAHGLVALGFNSSSFFETDRIRKGEAEEQSRVTAWDISLQARALQIENRTTVWLGVGYGQLHSNAFDTVAGGSLGVFARHQLFRRLHIDASARGMIYADDIKAGELRAGVSASVVRVGYRVLEFNVGPPLHGPELGLSLHF